jgi:hypothetical protein
MEHTFEGTMAQLGSGARSLGRSCDEGGYADGERDAWRARLSSTLSSSPVRSMTDLSPSGLEANESVEGFLDNTEDVIILTRGSTWENDRSRGICEAEICRPRILSSGVSL